jgi:acyl-CoA synthetase (AMP-forming)/AMP-acid ligase II
VAPGVELRVVGPGSLAPDGSLAPGTEGDIEIRGRSVCLGYLDEELTRASFTPDGWFRTGDRGRLRADGHLVLTGRTKDLIIRKGENVSALEVELVLAELAGVVGVAVIGLPDAERGERVCAVVELAPGAPPPTLADVDALCSAKGMMRQKVPEQLEIVDVLPRNASTKILKQELRARFADGGVGTGELVTQEAAP